MEILHTLEGGLEFLSGLAKLLLEGASTFCVLTGFVLTFISGFRSRRFVNSRLEFGIWLSLALEFQLAADILATTFDPEINELYRLVIVALIRTFLNFFLQREIREELEIRKKQGEMAQHQNPE